jgi:hypothetical protein
VGMQALLLQEGFKAHAKHWFHKGLGGRSLGTDGGIINLQLCAAGVLTFERMFGCGTASSNACHSSRRKALHDSESLGVNAQQSGMLRVSRSQRDQSTALHSAAVARRFANRQKCLLHLRMARNSCRKFPVACSAYTRSYMPVHGRLRRCEGRHGVGLGSPCTLWSRGDHMLGNLVDERCATARRALLHSWQPRSPGSSRILVSDHNPLDTCAQSPNGNLRIALAMCS